jgi:hypothetical protein
MRTDPPGTECGDGRHRITRERRRPVLVPVWHDEPMNDRAFPIISVEDVTATRGFYKQLGYGHPDVRVVG